MISYWKHRGDRKEASAVDKEQMLLTKKCEIHERHDCISLVVWSAMLLSQIAFKDLFLSGYRALLHDNDEKRPATTMTTSSRFCLLAAEAILLLANKAQHL